MTIQQISHPVGLGQPLFDEYHNHDEDTVKFAFGDVTLNTILGLLKALANLKGLPHIEAIYTGMVGEDALEEWKKFAPKNLNGQLLVSKEGATGKVVCTRINSNETMAVYPGVSKQISFEQVTEKCGKLIKDNPLVLLPGFALEFQDNFAKNAVKYFTEKNGFISCNIGAAWIINNNRKKLLDLLKKVQHVCCNLEEAKTLVNNPAINNKPKALVREIKRMAPKAVVVVTGGDKGSWGCAGKKVVEAQPAPFEGEVVNTVGAGDNHQAFFLAAWLTLDDPNVDSKLKRSLEYANKAAVNVLTISQGQFPEDAWKKFQHVRP